MAKTANKYRAFINQDKAYLSPDHPSSSFYYRIPGDESNSENKLSIMTAVK